MVSSVAPRVSSVGRRLTLITVLASALALSLALGSIAVSENIAFRTSLRADVGTLADVVSANTAAALLFDDQDNASETLDSLSALGAHFGVCAMATRRFAGLAARGGGSVDTIFEELGKNLIRNAHLTPAGIVAVGRAQEHGYTFGYGR